jgi:hypothetical protein
VTPAPPEDLAKIKTLAGSVNALATLLEATVKAARHSRVLLYLIVGALALSVAATVVSFVLYTNQADTLTTQIRKQLVTCQGANATGDAVLALWTSSFTHSHNNPKGEAFLRWIIASRIYAPYECG